MDKSSSLELMQQMLDHDLAKVIAFSTKLHPLFIVSSTHVKVHDHGRVTDLK